MLAEAEQSAPAWTANAMLLAVVTGQRREDIRNMQFSDIYDGYLHVVQGKTGARLALPLDLHCDAIGASLTDVIARCRSTGVVSRWLIHQTRRAPKVKPGDPVHLNLLTREFSNVRDRAGLSWNDATPPTFHEQRSLSERLYREQGIDTQTLLGHKDQRTTDKYHDNRGHEWLVLKA
ncbi:tyrosine-type recombinase/integrase [Oceanimonas sp. NS1]|nr:tyrosine-type recombinase/integrase [Oceanimonas sp. NS1]